MPVSTANPLARRLKKYITSRRHEFFVITAPGLEKMCQKELAVILPQNETFVQQGGVTFLGRPESMYLANLHLRSATRILMRIGEFKATSFNTFAAKMAGLNFDLYLKGDLIPQVTAKAHHCRLYHSEALKETARNFFAERFPNAVNDDNAPHIYIRGVDDRFEISLDTSGAMLYKRGLKTLGGKAPIRETLAFAILQKAGYKGGPLIDPMCGSGTFSLEAAFTCANMAPGLVREFAFTETPFFNTKQWNHLKKLALAQQKPAPARPLILASDKDAATCANFKKTVAAHGLEPFIKVTQTDFFSTGPQTYFGNANGLVVLNPPYGLRLLERAEAENLYGAVCRKLAADYKNWRFAIVTPHKEWISLKAVRWHKIWHGGLNLFLAAGKIAP